MRWFSRLAGGPKTVAGKHVSNYAPLMQINLPRDCGEEECFILQLHRLCRVNGKLAPQ
jgi:hypothetical protein